MGINGINPGYNPNLPSVNSQTTPNVVQPDTTSAVPGDTKSAVSGDDTLKYMANTSGYVPAEAPRQSETTPKTVIPVSEYVTPEQGQRIAASVQQFQGLYKSISNTAQNELNIPEELANKVALETIETKYLSV